MAKKKVKSTLVTEKKCAGEDLEKILDDVALGEEGPLPTDASADVRNELAWADDVYWAAEHADDRMTRAKAGSSLRFAFWKLAKADLESYVEKMLTRAMMVKMRARGQGDGDDLMAAAEKKSVAELERIIKAAVQEVAGE